ncbi:hypothetical protein [Roseibium marinum]|uniref:Uncharacterized protein n=1 Tax=Roseibium marinum TaxID=281252 RepID=A0A2S3UJE2_9HYPH|nr:hypothetical protein [Roseibium marinum]POF27700.1 hypothetical protein CLV41_1252 [Roseibium marinum]
MKPNSVRKIWLSIALIQLVFAVSIIGEIQGAHFSLSIKSLLGIKFQEDTPDSIVALWGIFMLSVLLGFSAGLTSLHAKILGDTWLSRFPLRVLDLDPKLGIGKTFQYIGLLLAVVIPVWVLGHSWRILHTEGVLCTRQADGIWAPIGNSWQQLWMLPEGWTVNALTQDGYRLAGEAGCNASSTTFFPMLEPAALLIMTIWTIVRLIHAGNTLIR